jgi:hypothetical protein
MRAGANSGSASALIWMAGQGGGIVIAVIIQVVVHHPTLSFLLMALAGLAALLPINAAARYAPAGVSAEALTAGEAILVE